MKVNMDLIDSTIPLSNQDLAIIDKPQVVLNKLSFYLEQKSSHATIALIDSITKNIDIEITNSDDTSVYIGDINDSMFF